MAITGINTSQSFGYTGDIQEFTVPYTGIYKLEVYGAKGADGEGVGGNGGYSVGYKGLIAGSKLYIVCGGTGTTGKGLNSNYHPYSAPGGYNGGGNSKSAGWEDWRHGGGGGATHIASVSGLLKNLSNYKNTGQIFIVAGGGGGGGYYERSGNKSVIGGTGGGLEGGSGTGAGGYANAEGGNQYTGGSKGTGGAAGSFGQGANSNEAMWGNGGGGGGWYGGGTSYTGGGGGSGCIKFVPTITIGNTTYSSSTENGVCTTDGSAKITYIAESQLYTITYKLNSGTQGSNAITSYSIDTATFNLPTPTKTGYTFKGWYETPDFTSPKVTKIVKGSSGDKVFYARWEFKSKTFQYIGSTQSFVVPRDGVYKLEVYGGAGGGASDDKMGYGGYSVGYKYLTASSKLYIACGGAGGTGNGAYAASYAAAFNGGGTGRNAGNTNHTNGGGGGATHIATAKRSDGQLKNYENYKSEVLIVAGGGGGRGSDNRGGTGGGTTGGTVTHSNGVFKGVGGTQTAAGSDGSFGQGGSRSATTHGSGGGGGGWYGGGSGESYTGGGGGSGYIGNLPTFTYNNKSYSSSTSNGLCNSAGYAIISYEAYPVLFTYNNTGITELFFDDIEINYLNFNNTKIYGYDLVFPNSSYLYLDGFENSPAGIMEGYAYGYTYAKNFAPTVTKADDYVEISMGTQSGSNGWGGVASFANAIDLTNVKSIEIIASSVTAAQYRNVHLIVFDRSLGNMGAGAWATPGNVAVCQTIKASVTNETVYTLDTSTLSGKYSVGVFLHSASSAGTFGIKIKSVCCITN